MTWMYEFWQVRQILKINTDENCNPPDIAEQRFKSFLLNIFEKEQKNSVCWYVMLATVHLSVRDKKKKSMYQ